MPHLHVRNPPDPVSVPGRSRRLGRRPVYNVRRAARFRPRGLVARRLSQDSLRETEHDDEAIAALALPQPNPQSLSIPPVR